MEALSEPNKITEIVRSLQALSSLVPLRAIRGEAGYAEAVGALNLLLDAGGAVENHQLAELVHILGLLIAEYEATHISSASASPADMLRFLMEQHQLRQSDLPEIGSQGVVSEILNGKREINLRQAKALAKRFNLPLNTWLN